MIWAENTWLLTLRTFGMRVVLPIPQLCGTSLRSSRVLKAQPSLSRLRALTSSRLLTSSLGAVEALVVLIGFFI